MSSPFRDAVRAISPVWLRGKVAGGVLYAITVQLDAIGDGVVAAIKMRFPGFYSNDGLGITGRERRIRRGRGESDAVYASRMARWLDDHRMRGGPYAMLAQLHAHYAPDNFRIDLVYRSGRRFIMQPDGTITRDELGASSSPDWAHWTLYFFWPTPVHNDGIWSSLGTWDDGGVWDSDLTPQEATDIRLVPREWNAAHCFGRVVLLRPGLELWDYPDGTWDEPGGVWLPATEYAVTLSIG